MHSINEDNLHSYHYKTADVWLLLSTDKSRFEWRTSQAIK